MNPALLLVQYAAQNIGLLCCGLFAGAATYVALVEQPAIAEGGTRVTGAYLLMAHPRPVVFQFSFGAFGTVAALAAGIASASGWWVAGAAVLGGATLFHLVVVQPALRSVRRLDPGTEGAAIGARFMHLRMYHAVIAVAGLVAFSLLIVKA